jgi:hypothetical protein
MVSRFPLQGFKLIGIVNLPNAALLLPFASLPYYQFPERLRQLDYRSH